ncbi:hypothetical protein [Maridesulfovibrio salexigens]|uniref:CDP-Glycerol:Poly(Glycerophosphate) glycerophosphotransferase n=1 Tax=Maridesulfovibrio salexigens (strain ATCC 14822 / DSM 2638 / NCIMB 8403 / VKM B-1763) TaxID=526222 RepID=C6BZN5_MARSD|nr:hypothetical protein [Maridesulfovibrio salexigens]ACS78942.1 hypothetical protein Desal_0876 [Maridesulfovibrio salexigens DSM 2638]
MSQFNKEIKESFLNLERNASDIIDSFNDDSGLNMWPAVRQCYMYDFKIGQTSRYIENNLTNNSFFHKEKLATSPPLLRGLTRIKKGACLLIGLPKLYTLQTQNGKYDPYLDPIADIASEIGLSPLKIIHGTFPEKTDTYNPTIEIPHQVSEQELINVNQLQQPESYQDYANLCLQHKHPALHLTNIWKTHYTIQSHYELYLKYLETIEPCMVILICYYCPLNLGIALACDKLNIPCIDYQHGIQSHPHLGYNFGYMPPSGYKTIPKWFFTWGESYQKNLENEFAAQTYHQSLIGGKPTHIAWHKGTLPEDDNLVARFNEKIQGKEVICVCLPLLGDKKILKELEKAISESPKNWIWLMRKHPLLTTEEYIPWFIDDYPEKIEHDICSRISIELVLTHSKHIVTELSTCPQEALSSFGVKCTLISQIASEIYYKEEVQQGVFRIAKTKDEILNNINVSLREKRIPTETHTTSNPEYLKKALKKVLSY